ncbi:DUF5693 family protein [Peptococcus simiae]|uniref:DUF5693 family protein n=1 Tax=Peptococcus simiae TaxID=1643805 RepID=A0ABW9GZ52_9FIRM
MRKNWLVWAERGAIALVVLALVLSSVVAVKRLSVEAGDKAVNIIVNETDVRTLASGNKKDLPTMLGILKDHGVSQVLFKEESLRGLADEGKVGIYQGQNVRDARDPSRLPAFTPNDAMRYIVIYDDAWRDQIKREVLAKVRGAIFIGGGATGYDVIAVPSMITQNKQEEEMAAEAVDTIGVGYDQAFMQTVADQAMGVVVQVRTWRGNDDLAYRQLREDLEAVPNLVLVLMNDKVVPGFPDDLDKLYAVLTDDQGVPKVPLGIVEFSKQAGLEKLGVLLDKEVVRVHTISNAEMSQFQGDTEEERLQGEKQALDRWNLAVRERNMRGLLVRFFDIAEPGYALDMNLNYLDALGKSLEDDGFKLGQDYAGLQPIETPDWQQGLIGLGIVGGVFLLLRRLRLEKMAALAALVLAAGWIAGLVVAPVLALKGMAFISVVTFPTLSALLLLNYGTDRFSRAVGRLLLMCALSFVGAVLMVGLLSSQLFMLKLSEFAGVKLAHVIPLLVVPAVLFIWDQPDPWGRVKALGQKLVDYRYLVLFGILAVALVIYVSRTGNSSATISDTEMGFRQWLTDILSVRPRSKEFLIGYPFTLAWFLLARKRAGWWLMCIPALIGQVSLVNTYAHIHTPLAVSLWRSGNGLLVGILLSALLWGLFRLVQRGWASYRTKQATLKGGGR